MSASPGAGTTVYVGGTATSFTNEACTKKTANTVYQLTAASKQIIDPLTALVVEVDPLGTGVWGSAGTEGTEAFPADYWVDRLSGTVTFTADQGGSALVRMSGKYIPRLPVGDAEVAPFEFGRKEIPSTPLDQTAEQSTAGRMYASGELVRFAPGTDDLDAGAGSRIMRTDFRDGTAELIEIRPGGTGQFFRSWMRVYPHKLDVQGDGLVKGSFPWKGVIVGSGVAATGWNFVSQS